MGIIDYKTSKFKRIHQKIRPFKVSDLEKINEYNPQLHVLFTLFKFRNRFWILKLIYTNKYPRSKEPKITEGVNRTLNRIKEISVDQAKIFGLVFVYPGKHI